MQDDENPPNLSLDYYEDQVVNDAQASLGITVPIYPDGILDDVPWEVMDNQGVGDVLGTEGEPVPAYSRKGGLPPQEARAVSEGMRILWSLVLVVIAFVSLLIYLGAK